MYTICRFVRCKIMTRCGVIRPLSSQAVVVNVISRSKDQLSNKLEAVKFPEKYKGTIVENWVRYWRDLYKDYHEVFVQSAINARSNPRRTLVSITGLGFLVFCAKTNPDANSFRDCLIRCENDLNLIDKTIRNPIAEKHLLDLESAYNDGVVRICSLGILSVVWIDNYDRQVGSYKANCSYLQPRYVSYFERIVDIGFLNKWWMLGNKMKDFDVNPEEWPNQQKRSILTLNLKNGQTNSSQYTNST